MKSALRVLCRPTFISLWENHDYFIGACHRCPFLNHIICIHGTSMDNKLHLTTFGSGSVNACIRVVNYTPSQHIMKIDAIFVFLFLLREVWIKFINYITDELPLVEHVNNSISCYLCHTILCILAGSWILNPGRAGNP